MELTRIFHPVGFGAFFTEKHLDTNSLRYFNIVYDCGTITGEVDLDHIIKSTFYPKEQIDILFISHFHEDHIKGIPILKEHCRIKRVVIPYIPKGDRILFAYSNRNLAAYTELITDTEGYFGNETEIIRILPESSEYSNEVIDSEEQTLPSGSTISAASIGLPISEWCFIPFNYNYTKKVEQLKEFLKDAGIEYDSLSSDYFHKHGIHVLRKAFDRLSGDTNNTSLVVFSGMLQNFLPNIAGGHLLHIRRYETKNTGLNCIYYGDVNTDRHVFIKKLKTRLKGYYDTIQTIQIPHHGSDNNFNPAILSPNSISIVCTDNKHLLNFPDSKVTKDITSIGSQLIIVKDDVKTMFTEHGYY